MLLSCFSRAIVPKFNILFIPFMYTEVVADRGSSVQLVIALCYLTSQSTVHYRHMLIQKEDFRLLGPNGEE